jgi:hypothetical protein
MIKIYLKGGLGNQLFQYAYGRAESIRKNIRLVLDLSDLIYPLYLRKKETPRELGLHHFNIQAEIYKPKSNPIIKQFVRKAYEWLVKRERGFQNEKYFKDIIPTLRKDLTLKNPLATEAYKVADQITRDHHATSLHIRRGDYTIDEAALQYHGKCDEAYYLKAIDVLTKKTGFSPSIYIFSDDIEWVMKNISFPVQTTFVSNPGIADYEELYLMSICRHNIIVNSTFSWWGAWLNVNPEKIVITPSHWVLGSGVDVHEIIPAEWTKI